MAGARADLVEEYARTGRAPRVGAEVNRHLQLSRRIRDRPILVRKRFQFATALLVGALLPWVFRGVQLPGSLLHVAGVNALLANGLAVVIAFWTRLSVETYPGIRRSYVILPSALTGHGIVVA